VIADPSYYELKRLADIIYYHIRFEERNFFPHVEETLNEEQLNAVGIMLSRAIIQNKSWPDEFWTRKHKSSTVY
jgi:hypothetical protein